MQYFLRVLASILLSTSVGIAAVPIAAAAPWISANLQTATVQSASGQITAVQGNTFTLQTTPDKNRSSSRLVESDEGNPEVLTFTIDQDSRVDGKIAIGAEASVTYRQQDGNNIAVSVRIVKQPS